jgi:hypothetical protein
MGVKHPERNEVEGCVLRIGKGCDMDDLERFWNNIFSEDPALIREAWATLAEAERESVAAHLRSIVADPDRQPDQRRAAKVALSETSPLPTRRERGPGGEV